MGVFGCSMFCCTLLNVRSSIAIILMGKGELVALLTLSSWWHVMVERLFLAVSRGCQQFMIVVFPDHTHLLLYINKLGIFHANQTPMSGGGAITWYAIGNLTFLWRFSDRFKVSKAFFVSNLIDFRKDTRAEYTGYRGGYSKHNCYNFIDNSRLVYSLAFQITKSDSTHSYVRGVIRKFALLLSIAMKIHIHSKLA